MRRSGQKAMIISQVSMQSIPSICTRVSFYVLRNKVFSLKTKSTNYNFREGVRFPVHQCYVSCVCTKASLKYITISINIFGMLYLRCISTISQPHAVQREHV